MTSEGLAPPIIIDAPPANALDPEVVAYLRAELGQRLGAGARAVVIRGNTRFFSAGANLKYVESCMTDGERGRTRMIAFVSELRNLCDELASSPVPTIAVVEGIVAGGGLEIALACDIRIASKSAKLSLPEVRVGLIPGAGGTQRLTEIAGRGVALRMILSGEVVSGGEAESLGIVQIAVPDNYLEARVTGLVADIVEGDPSAVAVAKTCINAGPGPAGYDVELTSLGKLLESEETRLRVESFVGARKRRERPGPDVDATPERS